MTSHVKTSSIIFLLLFFVFCFPVFSQEEIQEIVIEEEIIDIPAPQTYKSDSVFVINSFNFTVDGMTRPYAIMYKAELFEGEEITGLSDLNKYVRDKQQILYNERVLEIVDITYSIGAMQADGKFPVDLRIYVKDTWNIMAIPRPQYSSNSGFDITIKARDYNFLGTMSPLRVDVGYQYDEYGRNFITAMIDSDTPFRLFGLNWNFDFDHSFTYRPNLDKQYYYKNTTGISVELPYKRTLFTFGFAESFTVNAQNPTRHRKEFGRFQEGLFMSSNPYVSWRIPTGIFYYDLGEISYTPRLSATFNHELPQWPLADFRKGPFLNFSHNANFGRINWIGNFRQGMYFRASNSFSYNFYNQRNDDLPWGSNITLRGTGHKIINDFIGFSGRVMYRHWFFDDYNDDAGDALRGILDKDVTANYMLSLNMDFNVRILKMRPSGWSDNNKFLRIFDFDLHMIPIIDAALYSDPIKQKVFGLENLLLTGGLEFIVFPSRWRSLFLRVSYGRNFSIGPKPSVSEIFIGTDLHF